MQRPARPFQQERPHRGGAFLAGCVAFGTASPRCAPRRCRDRAAAFSPMPLNRRGKVTRQRRSFIGRSAMRPRAGATPRPIPHPAGDSADSGAAIAAARPEKEGTPAPEAATYATTPSLGGRSDAGCGGESRPERVGGGADGRGEAPGGSDSMTPSGCERGGCRCTSRAMSILAWAGVDALARGTRAGRGSASPPRSVVGDRGREGAEYSAALWGHRLARSCVGHSRSRRRVRRCGSRPRPAEQLTCARASTSSSGNLHE